MIAITKGFLATALSLGIVAGNKDEIEQFVTELMDETQRLTSAGDLRTISNMLDYHFIRKGRYPTEKHFVQWLGRNSKENNIRDVARDSYGNPFLYKTGKRNRSFTLVSTGKDGVLNTEDDMRISGP